MHSGDIQADDFLASLDAEISAITTKASLEGKKAQLLKDVRNVRASAVRKAELANELTSIKAQLREIEWVDLANVALFGEQHCRCGSVHTVLIQFMRESRSTGRPPTTQLSRIDRTIPGLPFKAIKQVTNTTLCVDCADSHGLDITLAVTKLNGTMYMPSEDQKDVH